VEGELISELIQPMTQEFQLQKVESVPGTLVTKFIKQWLEQCSNMWLTKRWNFNSAVPLPQVSSAQFMSGETTYHHVYGSSNSQM